MAVPIQRHPTVPASTLSDVKRIQKIVADTIRSYVGGNGMHSGMREKQVRCFRTVAVESTGTSTNATGTSTSTSTGPQYPKYPSNVFAAEMGKPSFAEQPGLRRLVFTPYPGPVIRYLMDPFGNYRVEGEVVFAQLIHGQWYIIGGNHEFLFIGQSELINEQTVNVTSLRRAHDNIPIEIANSNQEAIGPATDWKGVVYLNTNNHNLRNSTPKTFYLCKNAANQSITNLNENNEYFQWLDVIDVPLRNLVAVNRVDSETDDATGKGILYSMNYTFVGEYSWNVRPCEILKFGGCASDPPASLDNETGGVWSWQTNVIDVRLTGDTEMVGVYDYYSTQGFNDGDLPSCSLPPLTGTATSTASA